MMLNPQFIGWSLTADGRKLPVSHVTGRAIDPHNPMHWMTEADARAALKPGLNLAYVFTEADPYFFIDLDHCATPDGDWSPLAQEICAMFPDAYIEISQSGDGLHIVASARVMPLHACKNTELHIELYHTRRFIALTGTSAQGEADTDYTDALATLIEKHFKPDAVALDGVTDWTDAPCDEWAGYTDDAELIAAARKSKSVAAKFGGKASFDALWTADPKALRGAFPPQSEGQTYDASSADSALAMHLAYWTGRDCARMNRLMRQSALVREKWARADYLPNTMRKAARGARDVHKQPARGKPQPDTENAPAGDSVLAAAYSPPELIGTDARDGTHDTRPLTELGNAARLFDAHGDRLRYVHDAPAWLMWDDAWTWDDGGACVRSLAAGLPHSIYAEGTHHMGEATRYATWARTSQKKQTITAAVSLLSDFPQVRLPLSNIDAGQFIVGFDGARQVIDLTTGAARPAMPSDYVTKSLRVSSVGDPAKAVRWLAFLHQVFDDDAALIDWMHRWCGYMLTGSTREQFFIFAFGTGANGKSVFAELLKYIMGDYARAIAPETLSETRRQAGGATPDLAALIGARLALSSETQEGAALDETLVKSLVGGDTMSVRQLYAAPVQFKPQFKLMMLGNHKPIIRGNDDGIWRRVRLVPFLRVFSPEKRDPLLLDTLKAEAPHILAWMIQGCMAWQSRGLADTPAAVRGATDDYKCDQDIFGEWLAACCTVSPGLQATSTDLYTDYRIWSVDNGFRPPSSATFGRRLGERGFVVRQSNGKRIWRGLALSDTRRMEFTVGVFKSAASADIRAFSVNSP
jgi:P4 family phage/plasmid primase-like protien